MTFEQTLPELTMAIAEKIRSVYHLTEEMAIASLKNSDFYQILSEEDMWFWKDGAEVNFRRYQNEVEYGSWNKSITGGIVE